MKIKKCFLILFLSLICCDIFADPLDDFIRSFEEQEIISSWVKNNAQANLTMGDANSIVKTVYSHAYSKSLNPILLVAIIKAESGFRRAAISKEGAVGLMQVLPRFHRDKLNSRDPTNVNVSIEVGSQILVDCMDKHKQDITKSLNCYSGGGGNNYAKRISNYQKVITAFVQNSYSIVVAKNDY